MRDNTKKSLKSALLFGVGAGGGKGRGRGEVSNDLLRADSLSYCGPNAEMRSERGRNFRPGDKH